MVSIKNTERRFFWKRVVKLGFLLLPAFFLLILLTSSPDVYLGNFSKVVQSYFTGFGAMIFFGSVIFASFLCSLVVVLYNIEERKKEIEEQQII